MNDRAHGKRTPPIKASHRLSTDEINIRVTSSELRQQVAATESLRLTRPQALRLADDIIELLAPPMTARGAPQEPLAVVLELDGPQPLLARVAAFLRHDAMMQRTPPMHRWDVPETMARAYENAARLLDEAQAESAAREAAIRANAAMTALEAVQAQGYYLHHSDGHVASGDEVVALITRALDAALAGDPHV